MSADTSTEQSTSTDPETEVSGLIDAPAPKLTDVRGGWASIDKPVFLVSFGVVVGFCIVGGIWSKWTGEWSASTLNWITDSLGWLFVLAASAFVVYSLVLAFGRFGRIPLSRNGEEPEFSTLSWISMMFSAGMGIGLMFYGAYEPAFHTQKPSPFVNSEANTDGAASDAMAYTFFHWGLHPWAMYAVVGLALAYSTFRLGRGNLISSPFQSLFGPKIKTWGKPIDMLAIICTMFGSAVSLGLGALQIAAGVSLLQNGEFTNSRSNSVAIVVIMILTVGIVASAASGVSRGIKWLSNINMVTAFMLVIFMFVVGPTAYMLDLLPKAIGDYVTNIVPMSFNSAAYGGGAWLQDWTIFYWAWWISWTPFVGTFIARISRGRSIREFVIGVLLVPTAISIVWFVVFGGAAVDLQLGGVDIGGAADEAAGFFLTLQEYPLLTISAGAVMFLTSIFFVTGADSGAVVLSTLSSHGRTHPWDTLVVLWAVLTGVVAGVLLLVGGLDALKTFAILTATPFILVLIGICIALYRDLQKDPLRQRKVGPVREHAPVAAAVAPFSDADLAQQSGDGDGTTGSDADSKPE